MKRWTHWALAFITVVILCIGVYDLLAVTFGGGAAAIIRFAHWPRDLVFALGFPFGHMLWP